MKTNPIILTVFPGMMTLLVFMAGPGQAAAPLETWAERYVGTSTRDVAYGGGMFVAVGDAFYHSDDGVCWTKQPLTVASVNGLSGVAYGNGRFVAVESGSWRRESRVFTSASGMAWQSTATLPASELPVVDRVFFGGGTFVAVGEEPNPSTAPGYHWLVMTSPDGIAWERQSGPTNSGESYYLNAASYGNGLFVVAGWSGLPADQGLVLVSTNLTTWTQATGFPFRVVTGLTFGKGRFVAVGSAIATSLDGLEWTTQSSESGLSDVEFDGENFAAVGEPRLILSSPDAIQWTRHATPVESLQGITHGKGSFVAVGGYYTGMPRAVAVQSGGEPQACLSALGFGPAWNPRFRVLVAAERDRSYRLQSSPQLPAVSWTDVRSFYLPPGYPDPVAFTDDTATPGVGQRFYRVISP